MPTINNATVATGTGLSTAGNGGRKLVRLSNGWLVTSVKSSGASNTIYFYKSTDNGVTWSQICIIQNGTTVDYSIANNGVKVYVTTTRSDGAVQSYYFDATTQTNTNISTSALSLVIETSVGNVSLAINDAGTELHAAWSSKNSTYPNSFNIRYAKGTIAADGSVTWGAVEQVTVGTSTTQFLQNPSVVFDKSGIPAIVYELNNNGTYRIIITNKQFTDDGSSFPNSPWKSRLVFLGASYAQSNPSAIFIPQSINGLANGRLWVAWHGKDATDSAKFNIRTSYSDDGGVTWATPTKQTTGNTYDQMNASLTADSQGKVLLTWDAQNATTTQTALKVFNGTWGATTTLTGDGYTNVSTLFDNTFKLSMTTPPLMRQSTSGVYFSGTYFTGASVTPASSALGDKTASSVLSYTVTPESGSTITSIVEKVNGTTVNTYSNPASLSRTFTIPFANWDALKYYNTHTISVTVTDSNGMANTQTYTFNKALANDASLLEGAKAAKDGKDRISTKRDVLAGQVGLPPGSTFDAISAQFTNGGVVKSQPGTSVANSTGLFSVTGLAFRPKLLLYWITTSPETMSFFQTYNSTPVNYPQSINLGTASTVGLRPTSEVAVTESGITGLRFAGNANITWIAFG